MKRAEFEARVEPFMVSCQRVGMLPMAAVAARELGFEPHILTTRLRRVQRVRTGQRRTRPGHRGGQGEYEAPCALINGGEMVVTVGKENGIGGRNQEYAWRPPHIAGSERIVIGSVDTMAPTARARNWWRVARRSSLAGGIVDGYTMAEAKDRGH